MKIKIAILTSIFTFILLLSCVKDNFDFDKLDKEINYSAEFAFPVAFGEVSFIDAIKSFSEEGYIIQNEDGYVSLVYTATVESNDVQIILDLPDQSVSGEVESPDFNLGGFNNAGDQVEHSYTILMEFDVFNPEAQLERILLKTGRLNINAHSTFNHTTRLYVKFPTIVKNGQAYEHEINFAPGGESINHNNIDFSSYDIDLTQTPQGYNKIPVEVTVRMWHSGSADNSGQITFDADMNNLKYDIVEGYFGRNTLIFESDTVFLTLFRTDHFTIEDYRFVDPKFKVNYWNSYGIPSSFYFSELIVNSAEDGLNYNIVHHGDGLPMDSINPYNVSHATSVGSVMEDSLFISKENSNIDMILDKRPQWVSFIAHANTNPDAIEQTNFITSESFIKADVQVELPFWGYIYNFHLTDTIEFSMEEINDEWHPISRALIRLDLNNGFPVETFGQVYFVDENYNILDSLFYEFEERIINPASVDGNGRVIDFARKVTVIEADLDRLEKIENTEHIIFSAQANSTNAANQELVKIYEDYKITFDIGIEVDIDLEVDLDTIN